MGTLSLDSCLYTQSSKNNINNIVKIKENFPKLSNKKVKEVYKVINNSKKKKPKLNIITKGLSRKQVIIPINSIITNRFIFIMISNEHIENINRALKSIKSDVTANFIWADHKEVVITTNKIVSTLDLNTIKKYIKNMDTVNSHKVISPRLPQFKSYLKILSISYFNEDFISPITSNIIKKVIQPIYFFNGIIFTSRPHVIRVSFKSDMAIIWINI